MFRKSQYFLMTSVATIALGVMEGKVMAAPQGGQIIGGAANISQNGTKTDIHQHSDKVILDWRSFDVTSQEHVEFHQPSTGAMALNRIQDVKPSQIDGRLIANGHVMLVNPNGVVFGAGAAVDVGSLTVSTADIDNDDFMNGKLAFKQAGRPESAIINHGSITAKEAGLVNFVAPHVENHGVIQAKLGQIQLAAADTFTLDMAGDGLLKVAVSDEQASKLATNTGRISAEGGIVALTAGHARSLLDSIVDNSGIIEAQSMNHVGGKIILGGADSGMSINRAILDASGRKNQTQGGQISVLGQHIVIAAGSVIDASGTSNALVSEEKLDTATMTADKQVKTADAFLADSSRGGGSIKIGGDYLGTRDTLRAQTLYVDANALTLNDGLIHGDGGRTIFWSDHTTDFNGLVLARGGLQSGNGGFLETSGKENLRANGFADLSAAAGGYNKGTYLLDPADITIYGDASGTIGPDYVSTDGTSIDLASDLDLWLDAADEATIELTYSTDALGGATAGGSIGTNTITTSADVSGQLQVGARIRLGAQGAITTANTLGDDTYTITAIAGTTITVAETLTSTYATDTLRRGLVSEWTDKAATSDLSQINEDEMPLYTSDGIRLRHSGPSFLVTDSLSGTVTGFDPSEMSHIVTVETIDHYAAGGTIVNINSNYFINSNTGTLRYRDFAKADQGSGVSYSGKSILSAYRSEIADTYNIDINGTNVVSENSLIDQNSGDKNYRLTGYGNSFANKYYSSILYGRVLNADETLLINQHLSSQGYLDLDPIAGAGTEAAEAMDATNGFGTFSTRYLEKLSQTANIDLQATDTITLDLQGDTMNLASNKSLTLTTMNSDIISVSGGRINTFGASGDITMVSGGDIDLTGLTVVAANGSDIRLETAAGGTITTTAQLNSGSGNITLKADEIDIGASLRGSGDIQLTSANVNQEIEIGSTDANDLNLTAAELAFLDDGWNSILIGGNAHRATTAVNETVTFSDYIQFINNSGSVTAPIDINAAITTIDNADLYIYGRANPPGIHGYNGVHVTADLNIARDLTIISNPGLGISSGTINVGRDFIIDVANNFGITGDVNVGRDFTFSQIAQSFSLKANSSIHAGGNINIDAGAHSGGTKIELLANSVLHSNGDITLESEQISFDSTSSISGNVDGSSSLIFLEGDQNEAMEIGGTSAGHDWQMTSDELGTIQDGFNSITFGSNIYTEAINITGAVSFSDDVNFLNTGSDATITVADTFTTTDGASLRMESGTAGNVGWDAINIDADLTSAGTIDLISNSNIDIQNSVMSSNGDIILNADSNSTQDGAISISNATITTNGGDFIAGGGANPLTTAAHAGQDGVYDRGVHINNSTITTGIGDITIRGEGEDTGDDNYGIYINADLTTTTGNITLNGTGGNGGQSNYGIYIASSGDNITSNGGTIDITAQGRGSGSFNYGTYNFGNIIGSGSSAINIYSTGGIGGYQNGGLRMNNGGLIRADDGDITLDLFTPSTAGEGILRFYSSATIETIGDGDIVINTTNQGTANSQGLSLSNGTSLIQATGGGDITITHDKGTNGTADAIRLWEQSNPASISRIGHANTGNITITGDTRLNMEDGSAAITAGGNIDITVDDFVMANNATLQSGGAINIKSDSNISINEHVTSNGDIILNADRDADQNGAIQILNANISTNGGDFIAGGGANPLTTAAYGNSSYNVGLKLDNVDINTGAGDITVNGHGRNGATDNTYGVYTTGGTTLTTTSGNITFNGIGGDTGSFNIGTYINDTPSITSDSGNITITGTGGDAVGYNYGVSLNSNSIVTSASGDIRLTGTGNGSGNFNYGVHLAAGSDVNSTGAGANAGTITLNGTGGNGTTDNYGVYMTDSGTEISSVDGAIAITGNGGVGGNYNHGTYIKSSANVNSTAGDINVHGNSFGVGGANHGIYLFTARIENDSGDVILVGQESGDGANTNNSGILTNASSAIVTNSGDLFMTGIAKRGAGMNLQNGGSKFQSTSGDISLLGITMSAEPGVFINNAEVVSDGSSSITIEGRSEGGTDIQTISGVEIGEDTAGSLASGNITLIADNWDFDETGSKIETLGNLTIKNRTSGTSIGVGGGAGTLNITDSELAQFTIGGDVTIGSAHAGAVHIDSVDFTGITANNVRLLGGHFTIDGAVDVGTSLSMIANGDMTLNGAVSATGAGNSVVLVSNGFTNNGGMAAIDAGAGRYLVYTDGPSTTIKNGLNAPHYYNRSYTTNPPLSITQTGDLFLYAYRPSLTFTADDVILNTFNPTYDSFTYTVSGLESGDTLSSILSGLPSFSKSRQASGNYRINGTEGSLLSLIGYDFTFAPGILAMPSPSQQLSSTVEYQTQITNYWQMGNTGYIFSPAQYSESNASQEPPYVVHRNGHGVKDLSFEKDGGVRLVEANLMEIEQPIIDLYDLCSYNIKYCQ